MSKTEKKREWARAQKRKTWQLARCRIPDCIKMYESLRGDPGTCSIYYACVLKRTYMCPHASKSVCP